MLDRGRLFVQRFPGVKGAANKMLRMFQWQYRFLQLAAASTTCALSLLFNGCSGNPTESISGSVAENNALREEILRRVREDQAIREELIQRGSDKPDESVLARMRAIDSDNQARINAIIEEYGWPGPKLVGHDGQGAAFILVQHGDHALQKKVLPRVKKAYESHQISGENYALLLDRVLVGEGKPQMYGTQAKGIEEWKQHEPVLQPIEDEASVDKRRAELGLVPLSVYVKQLKETYFPDSQSKTNSQENRSKLLLRG